ncbi:hypothetical protein EST38_g14569, partial [Candolleomyces aberdarensis]
MVKPALGYFPTSLSLPYRFRYLPTPEPPANLLAKIQAKMAPNTRSTSKSGVSDNSTVTATIPPGSSSTGSTSNGTVIPEDDDVAKEETQPLHTVSSPSSSSSSDVSDSSDSDSDAIPYQLSTVKNRMGNDGNAE